MAEDPQPGPVSPQRRPAIGARLAMGFLAGVRMVLVLIAALCLTAMLFFVVGVCVGIKPDDNWFILLAALLVVTGVLIVMVGGARWIEITISGRHQGTIGRGEGPADSAGKEVINQLDFLLILSGFALVIWIPAQISGIGTVGVAWLAFWLVVGRLAWWARREVTKRLERGAVSPDRDPCSTPETPPSSEP